MLPGCFPAYSEAGGFQEGSGGDIGDGDTAALPAGVTDGASVHRFFTFLMVKSPDRYHVFAISPRTIEGEMVQRR